MTNRKIIFLYLINALCVPVLIFGTYLFGNDFEFSIAMLVDITNQWRWIPIIIGSSVVIYLLSKIPAEYPNDNPQILTNAALYLLVLHFSPAQDSYETFIVVVLPLIMILISYKIRALESEKTRKLNMKITMADTTNPKNKSAESLPNSTLGGFLQQLNLKLKKAGQPLAKMHTRKNEMTNTKNSENNSDKPLKYLTMGDFARELNKSLKKAGLPPATMAPRKKTEGDTKEFQVIFHKRGKRSDSTPPAPNPETRK